MDAGPRHVRRRAQLQVALSLVALLATGGAAGVVSCERYATSLSNVSSTLPWGGGGPGGMFLPPVASKLRACAGVVSEVVGRAHGSSSNSQTHQVQPEGELAHGRRLLVFDPPPPDGSGFLPPNPPDPSYPPWPPAPPWPPKPPASTISPPPWPPEAPFFSPPPNPPKPPIPPIPPIPPTPPIPPNPPKVPLSNTPPELAAELYADFKTEGLTEQELSTPQATLSLQTAIAQVAFPDIVPPPYQMVEILELITVNASLGRRSLRSATSSVLVKSRLVLVQGQVYSASLSILSAESSGALTTAFAANNLPVTVSLSSMRSGSTPAPSEGGGSSATPADQPSGFNPDSPAAAPSAANAIGAVTIAIISSCCAVLALVALMGTRAWATTQSAAASVIDRAAKRHGWTQQRAKMLMRLLGAGNEPMPHKKRQPDDAMSKAWPRLNETQLDKLANKEGSLELSQFSTIKACDVQLSVPVTPQPSRTCGEIELAKDMAAAGSEAVIIPMAARRNVAEDQPMQYNAMYAGSMVRAETLECSEEEDEDENAASSGLMGPRRKSVPGAIEDEEDDEEEEEDRNSSSEAPPKSGLRSGLMEDAGSRRPSSPGTLNASRGTSPPTKAPPIARPWRSTGLHYNSEADKAAGIKACLRSSAQPRIALSARVSMPPEEEATSPPSSGPLAASAASKGAVWATKSANPITGLQDPGEGPSSGSRSSQIGSIETADRNWTAGGGAGWTPGRFGNRAVDIASAAGSSQPQSGDSVRSKGSRPDDDLVKLALDVRQRCQGRAVRLQDPPLSRMAGADRNTRSTPSLVPASTLSSKDVLDTQDMATESIPPANEERKGGLWALLAQLRFQRKSRPQVPPEGTASCPSSLHSSSERLVAAPPPPQSSDSVTSPRAGARPNSLPSNLGPGRTAL